MLLARFWITFATTISPLFIVDSFSFGNSISIDSGDTIAGEINRRNMKAPRAGNFASGQTSFLHELEYQKTQRREGVTAYTVFPMCEQSS